MPEPTIHTFPPPLLNKPVRILLETIQTIRIVIMEERRITHTPPAPDSGHFVITSSAFPSNLIVLPVSVYQSWLAGFPGVPPKEVVVT